MTHTKLRTTLIATSLAAALGLGVAACSDTPSDAVTDTRNGTEDRSLVPSMAASDAGITTQVQSQLRAERTIDASRVNVSTDNGVVTLEGSVENASGKSAAERVANAVTGVIRVNNRLTTSASGMPSAAAMGERAQEGASDTLITTKVKSLLLADADVSGLAIDVETKNGVVMLAGAVETRAAVDKAHAIAAAVEGVQRVDTSALTVSRN